ncbi:hypothetical protein BGZ65_006561 [Modicella reniformis]|uniref:Uncharacterized protein n=1 Tax=Modicella reniformis TaxID=1440133 RepID=A0A9P6IJC6_9FUNG|nr:hypothetical protein BGZ65_006561 [Modicella reniformis]
MSALYWQEGNIRVSRTILVEIHRRDTKIRRLLGQKHPRDDSSDSEDASAKPPVAQVTIATLKGDGALSQDGSPSVSARRVNPSGYTSPSGLRNLVKSTSSRPSTDTNDPDYHTDQDLHESTTRLYTCNYLEGNGRHDSNVESAWIFNDTEIGQDLMDFRDRVIQENGGLTEAHEKLAVNFIFLVESDHQTRGLNAEVEDKSWTAFCEATKDQVDPLPKAIVDEAHQWAHILARESPESFRAHLKASPPIDPSFRSILNLMVSSGQLWNSESSNEDTHLKARLRPFLDNYLSGVAFTTSCWTEIQEDSRSSDSDLLVPDFSTVTVANKRDLSLVQPKYLLQVILKLLV